MSLHYHVRNVRQWPHAATGAERGAGPDAGALAIALVEKRLEPHPHLPVSREPHSLTVRASVAGFDVLIFDDGPEATVGMEGWHGHYSDPDEAAMVFMKLLSPEARVRLTLRGRACVSGALELSEGDHWVVFERCGLVLGWLRFGPKRDEVVENSLVIDGASNG